MAVRPASVNSDVFPLVPFACLYIDATWRDILASILYLLQSDKQRDQIMTDISRIWNSHHLAGCLSDHLILPCLSVRSGFDLYLSLKQYSPGSEILMTAVNIPQMMQVAEHHGLRVIPLDISTDTLAPKIECLEALIGSNTVAVVIAHIYGRWSNLDHIIAVCLKHKLAILEDCAEVFCGFKRLGHPEADLSFFSFGTIKPSTAFGGAVVRVKDPKVFCQMQELQAKYPMQSRLAYAQKVQTSFLGMLALNSPTAMQLFLPVLQRIGFDHKEAVVSLLRGFPSNFISGMRQQPSTALLKMMLRRFQSFNEADFQEGTRKGYFVSKRLPSSVEVIGLDVDQRNYWLFPIVVSDPARALKELNKRGIDAYRGATQLTCLEPHPRPWPSGSAHTSPTQASAANTNPTHAYPAHFDPTHTGTTYTGPTHVAHTHVAHTHADPTHVDHTHADHTHVDPTHPDDNQPNYPHEARHLIDHVIYLPVHKRVPYRCLEQICSVVKTVMEQMPFHPHEKLFQTSTKTTILENGRVKMFSKL